MIQRTLALAILTIMGRGGLGCGGEIAETSSPSTSERRNKNAENLQVRSKIAQGIRAIEIGAWAKAKEIFQAGLRGSPTSAELHYYLGLSEEKLGEVDRAERSYQEALRLDPSLEEASVNLSALYIEQKRYGDAVIVAQGGIGRHKASPSLYLSMAIALASKGDEEASAQAFERAIRLAPTEPSFLFTYGHWLAVWKQTDAAVAKLEAVQAVTSDPGFIAAVGHELRSIGAFPECVVAFNKALASKEDAGLRTERALCKIGIKDSHGAFLDLSEAVKTQPRYAPAHFYLAGRYVEAGKWHEVIREYQAYLDLEPNGPLAPAAQTRIRLAKSKLSR